MVTRCNRSACDRLQSVGNCNLTDSNQLSTVWLGYGTFRLIRQPVAVAVAGVRVKKPDLTGLLNTSRWGT